MTRMLARKLFISAVDASLVKFWIIEGYAVIDRQSIQAPYACFSFVPTECMVVVVVSQCPVAHSAVLAIYAAHM